MNRLQSYVEVGALAFVLLTLVSCSSDATPAGDPIPGTPSAAGGSTASSGTAGASPSAAGTTGSTSRGVGTPTPAGAASAAAGASGASAVSAAGTSGAVSGAAGAAGAGGTAGATGAAGAAGSVAGAAGTPSAGAAAPNNARGPAKDLMLPITMESGEAEPWFNVYRPMDLTATGQPFPIIVWANGGCFRSDFTWAQLFNRWAAGGFIVLALTESPTEGALVQTTIEHQGELIDWAFEQADKEGGKYAGKIDKTRVIAAGNSCGGVTALGLAAEDERVTAVFVLSGSSNVGSPNMQVIDALKVPVGYVVGGSEDIAGANAILDYDAMAKTLPAMIVSRKSGDHMTVSTDMMVLDDVAEISLNWIDLAVYGTKAASDELSSANVCSVCAAGDWTLKSQNLETLLK